MIFFSMVKTVIDVEISTLPFPFSRKELDSLWFGFLVRALVWLKMQSRHFLKLCAIVQWFWKCGRRMHTHAHIYINKPFDIWELWTASWIFFCSFCCKICGHLSSMPVRCQNDKDLLWSRLSVHVQFHHAISACAVCHLVRDEFMCFHPPEGDCFVFKWGPIDLLLHH